MMGTYKDIDVEESEALNKLEKLVNVIQYSKETAFDKDFVRLSYIERELNNARTYLNAFFDTDRWD